MHGVCSCSFHFFCFKQKTAYEMRISDWSSDVCSSDLGSIRASAHLSRLRPQSCDGTRHPRERKARDIPMTNEANAPSASPAVLTRSQAEAEATAAHRARYLAKLTPKIVWFVLPILALCIRSEEHTSELQSLMRIPYDVFCLKKKK